jgi:hypothetical protein
VSGQNLKIWQLKSILESMVLNFKNQIWQQVPGQNLSKSVTGIFSIKYGNKCLALI